MTSRRAFLQTLAAAAAGAVLDPERLLWVPGQKTIFLPPPARWDDRVDGMLALVDNGTTIDTYHGFYRLSNGGKIWFHRGDGAEKILIGRPF